MLNEIYKHIEAQKDLNRGTSVWKCSNELYENSFDLWYSAT